MKFVSKFSLQPYLYRLSNKISCTYYNISITRLGMKMTMTVQIFLLIIKNIYQDPPSPEEPQLCDWSCGSHRCRVLLRHPGVPHRRGPRVGRQRLQGSQGEEDHPQTSPAGHQRRRGVGHPDQGNHRWWWSYPPHPQVSDRQEGRGSACPVEPTRAPSIMII